MFFKKRVTPRAQGLGTSPIVSGRLVLALVLFLAAGAAEAAVEISSSFNPSMAGGLCGIAYDDTTGEVWLYACSDTNVQSYSSDGTFLASVTRPGEAANDVDLDFSVAALNLGQTALSIGTLLFINGESGPAEIYAVNKQTGDVIETLAADFGASHVVGGAHHPGRESIFLVQDRLAAAADRNRIAEIDPSNGNVLDTFQVTGVFDVNFGDIDVCPLTGNLLVVSNVENRIAELAPDGTLVGYQAYPAGVTSVSGIAVVADSDLVWVAGTGGVVWALTGVPCVSIFTDGFESGDTTQWANTVGAGP